MQHKTTMSVLSALDAIGAEMMDIEMRVTELEEADRLNTLECDRLLAAHDSLKPAYAALFKLVMPSVQNFQHN